MKNVLKFGICSLLLSNFCFADIIKNENIDLSKSNVGFTANQSGISLQGEFKKIVPDIFFDTENLNSSKINVAIDLNSLSLGSVDFEKEMRNPLWFDTPKFPFATFKSLKISNIGSQKYLVNGILNIKGINTSSNIIFVIKNNKNILGEFKLKRNDFKLGTDQFSDDSVLSNTVSVDFNFSLK
jgi:polyisoprenoid-binding protein YceI